MQSGRAFAVHSSDGRVCALHRASGTVAGISGDTVRLRDIWAVSTRSGESPECAALRAGWFVVAGEPAPEILRRQLSVSKTAALVAVAFVVVVVIGISATLPGSSGDYCGGGTYC